jgi:hypothetical protein
MTAKLPEKRRGYRVHTALPVSLATATGRAMIRGETSVSDPISGV